MRTFDLLQCLRTPARVAALILPLLVVGQFAAAADAYRFDVAHSEIRFTWNHGGLSELSGTFDDFGGELVLDEEDLSKSRLDVVIKADSLSTGVSGLDYEMKGGRYFDAKKHPEITFKSRSFRQTGKTTAVIEGDLTIRDVTKPTTLDIRLVHKGEHPMGAYFGSYRGDWIGVMAETTVLRSDFGFKQYIPVVSDRIAIRISSELKMKKR